LSVDALNLAIDEEMANQIAPHGFEKARSRAWWRKPCDGRFEVVEFQARKGASYAGVWGWSLSMCPLQRGKTMKWKRTAASVEIDLLIDPSNDDGASGFLVDAPLPGYRNLDRGQVRRVVEKTAERAIADFDAIQTFKDLDHLFEARTKRKYRGLTPDNYVQFKLAWSLVKRARGDEASADALFREWAADVGAFGVQVDASMMTKANEAARNITGNKNVTA
jgi:hypothetical protein